jgi:hypothetical protein
VALQKKNDVGGWIRFLLAAEIEKRNFWSSLYRFLPHRERSASSYSDVCRRAEKLQTYSHSANTASSHHHHEKSRTSFDLFVLSFSREVFFATN